MTILGRLLQVAAFAVALIASQAAFAQNSWTTPGGSLADGKVQMCLNASNQAVACGGAGVQPSIVAVTPYPVNPVTGIAATPIGGNGSGTTGAVVGTLAGVAAKTTYICGFNVQAIGGTAAVGPVTIAGLVGGSQTYQGSASAAGGPVASQTFAPCIPASAANTAITTTTTANGTATAVNVNSWGFQY